MHLLCRLLLFAAIPAAQLSGATDYLATHVPKDQMEQLFFHPCMVNTKIMRGEMAPGISKDTIDTLVALIKAKDIEAITVLLKPLIAERNAEAIATFGTITMNHLDCDYAIPVDQMESMIKFQHALSCLFRAAYDLLHPEAMINLAITMQTIEAGLGVEKYSATKSLLSNAVMRYVEATKDTALAYTLGLFYHKHGESKLAQFYFDVASSDLAKPHNN